MKTTLFAMIIAGTMSLVFCAGVWHGKRIVYSELSAAQKITIEAQKDLKKSLINQIEYTQELNDAFEKTIYGEMERWRNQVVVEVRE